MAGVIVKEHFSEEGLFNEDSNLEFESQGILDLKKELQETEGDREEKIDELISYPLIKKNLSYDLPHQREGALKIIREMNTHALLSDEVGLGKTITTGMILKESAVRGFIKEAILFRNRVDSQI